MQISFKDGEVMQLADLQNAVKMCASSSGFVELRADRGKIITLSPAQPPPDPAAVTSRPQGEPVDEPRGA